MRKTALALVALLLTALVAVGAAGAKTGKSQATVINGAGSTFVSPLVSLWTPALGTAFDYTLQYSGVGSGAGITAITNRSVDFGASDAPLTADQFAACNGCVQIPWALAGTAVPYNIPGGPARLHLTGEIIAKIYLGQITNWNDPAIKAVNPKLAAGETLPDLKITPVYRTGNSGTTYNFTDYLAAVSPQWSSQIGRGQSVNWPAGVGASGSAGVAGVVKNTPGAICYVDTAFALSNGLHFGAIQNAAGNFIFPSIRNVVAAGATVKSVPAGNELHIVNPDKTNPLAYPISTYTYIILPQKTQNAPALRKMVFWALTQGQAGKYTAKLYFAPIPKVVLVASEKALQGISS